MVLTTDYRGGENSSVEREHKKQQKTDQCECPNANEKKIRWLNNSTVHWVRERQNNAEIQREFHICEKSILQNGSHLLKQAFLLL